MRVLLKPFGLIAIYDVIVFNVVINSTKAFYKSCKDGIS